MSILDLPLPRSARWSRVGDAYEVTKRPHGFAVAAAETVPFVPMDTIPQGGGYHAEFLLKASNEIKSSTYFERGDILVAKITPSFENGKQAFTTNLPAPFGYATTEVIPLRPRKEKQDSRLLFFYLLHPDIRDHIAERMEGTTGRQRVPQDVLLDIHYPEFPLEEQTAIADRLEMVQRRIAVEEKSARTASALKRAAIRTLFAHGLRGEPPRDTEMGPMPESWERLRIAELGTIVTGNTPPTGEQANYANGSVPFVAPGDIKHGSRIEKTEKLITARGLRRSRPIPAGTTCIVCIGSSIGKVGYCTFEISASNQQINSIISSPQHDSLFIFYLMIFWSYYVKNQASLSPVPILSKGAFEQIEIFAPTDIGEQKEIARIVYAIDCRINLYMRKSEVLGALFRSMLHRMVTGEIRLNDLDMSRP